MYFRGRRPWINKYRGRSGLEKNGEGDREWRQLRQDRIERVILEQRSKRKCFPSSSAGKESACGVGDLGVIPGLGRSPGEGNGYPLQYCGLKNSTVCIVHGHREGDRSGKISLREWYWIRYLKGKDEQCLHQEDSQAEEAVKGQRPGGRKREAAWRPCVWSTMNEAEVAGPGCHSGAFIYSKSAGEPLEDCAQSSELMELLFLKTQWLLCWEQVDRHRQKQKGEWEAVPVNPGRQGRSLDQAAKGGDNEEHRYSGYIRKPKKTNRFCWRVHCMVWEEEQSQVWLQGF